MKLKIADKDKWENLSVSNDFLFSKILTDKEICKEILELLLNFEVGEIHYIEEQKVINPAFDAKSIRLDVYVKDENKSYNIEMQVINQQGLILRCRFYQSLIDANELQKGEFYQDLPETFIIFICLFDPFKKGLPRYTFKNICEEDLSIKLEDGTNKIFFNTTAYSKEQNKKLKTFLAYIEGDKNIQNYINDPLIKKIEKKIYELKNNKNLEVEYMHVLANYMDKVYEGKAEGRAEGRAEGKAEGRVEGKLETAKNLLTMLGDEAISLATGFSIEEIKALRKENSQIKK